MNSRHQDFMVCFLEAALSKDHHEYVGHTAAYTLGHSYRAHDMGGGTRRTFDTADSLGWRLIIVTAFISLGLDPRLFCTAMLFVFIPHRRSIYRLHIESRNAQGQLFQAGHKTSHDLSTLSTVLLHLYEFQYCLERSTMGKIAQK